MSEPKNESQQDQKPPDPETSSGESDHCSRCKRALKNPIYRRIGMGKICLSKSGLPNNLELMQQIFDAEKKKRDDQKSEKQRELHKNDR